jgi:hypothetical protein
MNTKTTGTFSNSSKGKVTYTSATENMYAQAYGTVTIPVLDTKPEPETKTLTSENVEEVAELLHNILQDALVICEEDCCSNENTKIDFTAVSRSIIKSIIDEYSIGTEEKTGLLKKISNYQVELSQLRKQILTDNHKHVEGLHDKKLNEFKSRNYYSKEK